MKLIFPTLSSLSALVTCLVNRLSVIKPEPFTHSVNASGLMCRVASVYDREDCVRMETLISIGLYVDELAALLGRIILRRWAETAEWRLLQSSVVLSIGRSVL